MSMRLYRLSSIVVCYNNSMSFTGTVKLINPPIATVGPCSCKLTSQTSLNRVRVLLDIPSSNQTSCLYGQNFKLRPSNGFGSTLSECYQGRATQFLVSPTNHLHIDYNNPVRSNTQISLTVSITPGTSTVSLQCDGDPLPEASISQIFSTTIATTKLHVSGDATTAITLTKNPMSSKTSTFPLTASSTKSLLSSLPIQTSRDKTPSVAAFTVSSDVLQVSTELPPKTLTSNGNDVMYSKRTIEDIKESATEDTTGPNYTAVNSTGSGTTTVKSTYIPNLSTNESMLTANVIYTTATNSPPIRSKVTPMLPNPISSYISVGMSSHSVPSSAEPSPRVDKSTWKSFSTNSPKADLSTSRLQSISLEKSATALTTSQTRSHTGGIDVDPNISHGSVVPSFTSTSPPHIIHGSVMPSFTSTAPPHISHGSVMPSFTSTAPPHIIHGSVMPSFTSTAPPHIIHGSVMPSFTSTAPPHISHGSVVPSFTSTSPPHIIHGSVVPSFTSTAPPHIRHGSVVPSFTITVSPHRSPDLSEVSTDTVDQLSTSSSWTSPFIAKLIPSQLAVSLSTMLSTSKRLSTQLAIVSTLSTPDTFAVKTETISNSMSGTLKSTLTTTGNHERFTGDVIVASSVALILSGKTTKAKPHQKTDSTERSPAPTQGARTTALPSSSNLGLTVGMIWIGLVVAAVIILSILYCNYRSSSKAKHGSCRHKAEESLIE